MTEPNEQAGKDEERRRDAETRDRALDPHGSFIVQAPAGSGKTTLLTQRFLVLLACVDAPEEIVAITFTRKAAAEMRRRILDALEMAGGEIDESGLKPHERQTLALARGALARDAERGWRLRETPARLRIMTFDALCARVVAAAPLRSGLGATPEVTEDASDLYREAAERVIGRLEAQGPEGPLARLLRHLDNRPERLRDLIVGMLERRDQWLRHLGEAGDRLHRETLEVELAALVGGRLARVRAAVPRALRDEIETLLRHASERIDPGGPYAALRGLDGLPDTDPASLDRWRALADWLLTKNGTWRSPNPKKVDRTLGFPPPGEAVDPAERELRGTMKARMRALLEALRREEGFREALAAVRGLPAPCYGDAEWSVIEALAAVLVDAVEVLREVFQERRQADFIEIAMAAVRVLDGGAEAPDPPVRHLLVDEFQDTSVTQFELLRRLTAGWRDGDGRTVFLVGDPMQSIYRFREADVGVFLRVRREGLGSLRPEPLTLRVNFRAHQGLVDWINGTFGQIMPAADEETSGAVSYSPCVATRPAPDGDGAVRMLAFPVGDEAAEARAVAEAAREALERDPEGSVGILVRARSHLAAVVPALREAGVRFRAVEIEVLSNRPVVRDLFSLARALLHLEDRIAWLAVLRAPFCGLHRADLLVVADGPGTIAERLGDREVRRRLSDDGRRIIERVWAVLDEALGLRGRLPLRDWVERTWIALGGPACLSAATDAADAEAALALLEGLDAGGDVEDLPALQDAAGGLYAQPDPDPEIRVELMTVHGAKGLEFDTVILPCLDRGSGRDGDRLLRWAELPLAGGRNALVLGPVGATHGEVSQQTAFVRALEAAQAAHERERLLYVAATRARERLWLTGRVELDEETGQPTQNRSDTFLGLLWPAVGERFEPVRAGDGGDGVPDQSGAAGPPRETIRCLPPGWRPPDPPPPAVADLPPPPEGGEARIVFDWAGETARCVGTVAHALIRHLAGLDEEGRRRFVGEGLRPRIVALLRREGVRQAELDGAAGRVEAALRSFVEDERGRWVLSPGHADARDEHPVSVMAEGRVVHCVVDRTFVDAAGTRWIVDYKTGTHEGGDLDAFLDREVERYRGQLETYARAFRGLDPRPIRLGLYFPLLREWREWPFDG